MPEEAPPQWFFQYMEQKEKQKQEELRLLQLKHEEELRRVREEEQKRITNGAKPGKALPQLQEYYGEPEKLEAWLQQAQVKIRVDYHQCTEFVKFWALAACLRGKALKRMDAWTRQFGTPDQARADALFHQMQLVFQDPQAKERAQRKLNSLRQGKRPFIEAYMEWQSLLIEAGGADWPDSAKKMSLDRILGDELARAMITVPASGSFESYCNTLKEIDDRLHAYQARTAPKLQKQASQEHLQWRSSQNWRSGPVIQNTQSKPDQDKMDWQPTQPVQAAVGHQRRAKWVSKDEITRRHKEGLCERCGASGHWKQACPYAPARRPTRATPARQIKPTVEPELEDEEGEDNEDSGKE